MQVLHGEIGLPLVLAEVVDRDDVLVRELTGGAGFAKESLAKFGVLVDRRGDDLDRDDPLRAAYRGRDTPRPCRPGRVFREARSGRWSACRGRSAKSRARGKGRMIAVPTGAHKRQGTNEGWDWRYCRSGGHDCPERQADQRVGRRHEEVVGAPRREQLERACSTSADDDRQPDPGRRQAVRRHDPEAEARATPANPATVPPTDLRFTSPMPQTRSVCLPKSAPPISAIASRDDVGAPDQREDRGEPVRRKYAASRRRAAPSRT